MERRLVEKQDVTAEDLRVLGQERAKHVQEFFLKAGEIGQERLFIVATLLWSGSL